MLDVAVGKLKLREVTLDAVVPVDLAFVDQHGDRSGGKGLRAGTDGEKCVFVHGSRLAELADAVALSENHAVIFDYGHGQTGSIPIVHGLGHVAVQTVERSFLSVRWPRSREQEAQGQKSADTKERDWKIEFANASEPLHGGPPTSAIDRARTGSWQRALGLDRWVTKYHS